MDRIDLVDLNLDCIVGVLDSEQRRVQPLVAEVSLWLNLEHAGETGHLFATVNYADVAAWMVFLTTHGRFRLLESISVAALRLILLPPVAGEPRAAVERARIQLRKPTILGERATPGTEMTRDAEWAPITAIPDGDGVLMETLVNTGRSAAWRVQLSSTAVWSVPEDVAVYVIAGRVLSDTVEMVGPEAVFLPSQVAGLANADDGIATLLAVRVPPPPK